MAPFRGYIVTLVACVAAEFGIYYGLAWLGANGSLIVAVELIWLCVTVVLTLLVGEYFDPHAEDRGKPSESGSRRA